MHMADALLSPAVGGAMWAVSAGAIAYCSHTVRDESGEQQVPLMGVLGAFLFAAQMINFTIPATGSSGHLGGGLLLTILLGPAAAFLVMASVLVIQALFFADGGLLALGCNIVNLGFIPAFIVYPLVYERLLGPHPTGRRQSVAVIVSALISLQLGSVGVVLETWLSGISALPVATFLLLMQPVHLAISIVEGVVTLTLVAFVHQAWPDVMVGRIQTTPLFPGGRGGARGRRHAAVVTFLLLAIVTGGMLSSAASTNPDGLEWAISRLTGPGGLKGPEGVVHALLAGVQETTSFLPEYAARKPAGSDAGVPRSAGAPAAGEGERSGTGAAGIVGSLLTLMLVCAAGLVLKRRNRLSDLSA